MARSSAQSLRNFLTPHAPPQAESFAIKFVRAQADNIGMLKEYKDQS